jgi:hypothetical protein
MNYVLLAGADATASNYNNLAEELAQETVPSSSRICGGGGELVDRLSDGPKRDPVGP